jgi:hypothetical protein
MRKRNIIAVFSALACLALLPIAQAAPSPETPDPASTCAFCTADGTNALNNASVGGGTANSAFGWFALFADTDASFNTAVGVGALLFNNASENTAVGAAALLFNTTGSDNNAVGSAALLNNVTGTFNNAHGRSALTANLDGGQNNAFGDLALTSNVSGSGNTAIGDDALVSATGDSNVGVGDEAGNSITTGSNNTCVGAGAGVGIVDGTDIIAIGTPAAGIFANFGPSCFIGGINEPTGDPGSTVAVLIDSNNNLGTSASTRRVKHDIKPMDKASEVILALKPVTFKYNYDVKNTPCFGLVAEDVAEVDRDLVVLDKEGRPKTVRYEQVNAMLLNEFLKEHKKVEEQQASISQLKGEMQTMVAQLKEQAAQIQKVSAQLEVNKPAPQVVANKP